MRLLLLLLGTVLTLGCGSVTDPVTEVQSMLISSRTNADPTSSSLVRRAGSQVEIEGVFGLPTTCYTLAAQTTRAAGVLTVAVEATSSGTACFPVLTSLWYLVRSDLPEGVTRVVVQQRFAEIQNSTVVVADSTLVAN